ncbi:MAG: alpha/beta fold hydrolase, partial [Gemmatimonadales bacterium]
MKPAINSNTPRARRQIAGSPFAFLSISAAITLAGCAGAQSPETATSRSPGSQIHYRSTRIDDVDIFYREAGSRDNPTVLLLHGFPTSSHMFRNLIPALADGYHVVAPDYPGYGFSSMPAVDDFDYTFDGLAEIIESFVDQLDLETYSIYLMDYGAPVGYRLAVKYPDRVESLIVQNGNAYEEGLLEFWDPIKKYWADRTPENAEALR